ncbi:MAG: GAF domain-containing sensor histidine kinase [Dehalococcoidia bacterium]|nr:GAF domain-containing sensor histidine kinase [Dehalococcoidia bacterium]
MSLQRLRWATIIVAIAFLVVVQGVAMGFVMPAFGRAYGHAVSIIGFGAGIIVLATILYNIIDRMQARIVRQNEESEALYEIAVDIAALDDERQVLQSIMDRAREMLSADAAVLCLAGPSGAHVAAAHAGLPEAFRVQGVVADEGPVTVDGQFGVDRCPFVNPAFNRMSTDLISGGERIGEICVLSAVLRVFGEDEVRLLRAIAHLAAIEVQKGKLMERDRLVAVLEERERLAREMHDTLAQVLGYLHLTSESARAGLNAGDLAKTEGALAEISSVAHEAYADVREAILGLRETVSQRRGFVDALREYAVKFSQQAGVSTQVDIHGTEALKLAPEAEVQLLRVIQEALTNVRKHSGARKACVSLDQRDGLRITIEDDGKGFNPGELDENRDRFGLFTMRERVERVGGRLEIDSAVGMGTRVYVIFSDAEAKL